MGKKHRKCSVCGGLGKIVVEIVENGRTRTKDMKCENCGGKGYEEKPVSGSGDIIFPLDKK